MTTQTDTAPAAHTSAPRAPAAAPWACALAGPDGAPATTRAAARAALARAGLRPGALAGEDDRAAGLWLVRLPAAHRATLETDGALELGGRDGQHPALQAEMA